jgi:hypothetical protein
MEVNIRFCATKPENTLFSSVRECLQKFITHIWSKGNFNKFHNVQTTRECDILWPCSKRITKKKFTSKNSNLLEIKTHFMKWSQSGKKSRLKLETIYKVRHNPHPHQKAWEVAKPLPEKRQETEMFSYLHSK